jgi:hypothetical protein
MLAESCNKLRIYSVLPEKVRRLISIKINPGGDTYSPIVEKSLCSFHLFLWERSEEGCKWKGTSTG